MRGSIAPFDGALLTKDELISCLSCEERWSKVRPLLKEPLAANPDRFEWAGIGFSLGLVFGAILASSLQQK